MSSKKIHVKYSLMICVIAIFALVVGLTTLSACGANSSTSGKVKVEDVKGTTFEFDKPISKIIGTHNPTLNAVVVLGGGGKYLAGFGNKEKADGLYTEVIENWNDLTSIGKGKNINKETVAKLNPDLALVPERQESMSKDYEECGLKTFVALPNKESFETIKESLTRISKLFGVENRAKEVNAEFDKLINEAKDTCKSASSKPSVMFMGDDLYEIAFKSMIQTDIIDAVGATNAVSGDYKEGEFASVDAETIAKFNPEVIWIPNYANYKVEDVLNDPKLSGVKAVQNKKVFTFPCGLEPWDYPTASTCLGVCWAAYNLHPDLYSKDKLMTSCDEFYKLLYNKTFSADKLKIS